MLTRRLPRAVARFFFVVLVGGAATVLGTVGALTQTPAGHALLARVFSDQSNRLVRGSITIGGIEGNFANRLRLDSVVIRDTAGFPLATFARLEVRYRLANLLSNRIVLEELIAERPRIHLVKHRDGRLNFEEVLRLGEGPPGGGPGPLIDFRNVDLRDGILTVRTPWSPPGHLRTDAQRDSALQAQRLTPGRRIEEGGIEGLQQVRTVEGLTTRMPRLRIATPEGAPILAVVETFAALINDPLVEIVDLRGEVTQARDTLWFRFDRAALPGTRGSAEGLVHWPSDTLLFDFGFEADTVALADLRFVSPDFPDYRGRGRLEAYSFDGNETQYLLQELRLGDATSAITGTLTALTHRFRGLGFRGLDLRLRNVDLDVARPYLDTIPFLGRLSGTLRADGYFDNMRVALDWTFWDERVEGQPLNRLLLEGPVVLGGLEGLIFRDVEVRDADLDLPTTRLAAPAVILEGRMTGSGRLDGPWKDVTFTGQLRHQDGERPPSLAGGRLRLTTRTDLVEVDGELDVAPLSFEGIRRAFPDLTALGDVAGPVRLAGPLDRLAIETNLRGDLGHLLADGVVTVLPPRWGADSLRVQFEGLDLAVARGVGPSTTLNGQALLHGTADSATAPEGWLVLQLGPSWIREARLDSVALRVGVADGVIGVDSALALWRGGEVRAQGTLGWARPRDGQLDVGVMATSLRGFDSLVAGLAGLPPDTLNQRIRLDGELDALATIRGALDSFDLAVEAEGRALRFAMVQVPGATGRVEWRGGSVPTLSVEAEADSLRAGTLRFGGLSLVAGGPADSVTWRARGSGGEAIEGHATGTFDRRASARLQVDTLDLRILEHRWRLGGPFTAVLADSVWALSPMRLATDDGAASVALEGTVPGTGPGELDVRIAGLDLRDIYALLQRDTALARGWLTLDLRVTGTAARPEMRGTGSLTGPVFGDFRAPLGRLAMQYTQRRLNANVTFWRTGRSLMEVNATLPFDLAWGGERVQRQLPGQLAIRARADSMDLAVVEAFTSNLRRVRGLLSADVTVQGTWDQPRLGGTVQVAGGRVAVPTLGVSYGPMAGVVTLQGDSIVVDSLRVQGQRGGLTVGGHVRLERLTHPVLDLTLTAREFMTMDVPDYLTLEMDGNLRLRGPLFRATLTGSGTARNTVLYFSDLISKSIVNLEDPLYADLVDAEAIRRRGLGAAFQSRFLDSLTIRDFRFTAAEGVWLRSSEANIQLEGSVAVQKDRRIYRLDGTFTAPRGTYTLKIGPVTKAFDVSRGVVRYFGTPDLNANLDIEARHLVRSGGGGVASRDVEVIAKIGGTLRVPRLTLESTVRPPLSQSDIVSLLVLGQTVNTQLLAAGPNTNQQAMTLLFGTLSSELERALVSEGGVGVDLIEIRPGMPAGSGATGASLTRLAAGWQIGSRWWVSLTAGFCPNFQQFDHRNFGVSLDYRLHRHYTLQASAEPVQACLATATTEKRYQFGADLRWEREF